MTHYALSGKRVWVAGHTGLVGSAIVRRLRSESCEVLTVPRNVLDLRRQNDVEDWVQENRPDAVFLAAAKVGGVIANMAQPEEFLYDNLMIESNIIKSCLKVKTEKLLFLGSSCIYPRDAPQPLAEKSLLTSALEPSNEGYALAKIAGLKLVESCRRQHGADFISAMPCNLYGPGDRYDATISHVTPAMIMKLCAAQKSRAPEVAFMGTGSALREFLYVDDLADGLVFLMQHFSEDGHINIGSGREISIHDLAHTIARAVGYTGSIRFTGEGTDGTPRKVLDISRLAAMGWQAQTSLDAGLAASIADYESRYGLGTTGGAAG